MSPSSEVEILIFLIVLKFKIIVENDTFFLGTLLLISHYFFFFFFVKNVSMP